MLQIIPGILSTTEEDFKRDVARYNQSLLFQKGWVHIDFMDNIFVPNKSISPLQTSKYKTNLQKEAHLMVVKPLEWIDDLVKAEFARIVFHLEVENVGKIIESVKDKGLEVGVAIKNETPISKLEPFTHLLDAVIVMGVIPGFQGQSFIPASLDKVKEIKAKNWKIKVGVDGAVKDDNIKSIVNSKADFVIVGSYLLKGDIDENLEMMWEAIND